MQALSMNDLAVVHALHSIQEVDEFNTLGVPRDIKDTTNVLRKWITAAENKETPEYIFTIKHRATHHFIGLIAFKMKAPKFRSAEAWYKLHPHHWGKGLATEALRGLIKFGFEHLQLRRVEAGCAVENTASYRVMEKAGMLREGMKRKSLPLKNGWHDTYFYAILDTDHV
ncbi:RimJ/RimL family protein N-acetyltransferase [Chitinophaga skermanii]|uniref:RimJ/RimL family protein N-acetyltransferase n=1 Tax=Chitinophaga skermanii TaxID=331697 RepID=A0A327QW30_9BACT|nr:GNAT family N-acetyltransferase [Chitinophaga skermanii]RAJ08561.1 RimJ/RimL family protein N-acetyltransferase [Chitinophaga skermanii]